MNTPTSDLRIPNLKRSAFTLVELLIVITIIGILVGLLLPAVRGALRAANELAVRTEMVQIEQAIESFNTQYGFYPPVLSSTFEVRQATSTTQAWPLSFGTSTELLRIIRKQGRRFRALMHREPLCGGIKLAGISTKHHH